MESGYVITSVKEKSVPYDDVYKGNGNTVSKNKYGGFKRANQNDSLKEICEKAMAEGGNGIINLNIQPIVSTTQYGTGVTYGNKNNRLIYIKRVYEACTSILLL